RALANGDEKELPRYLAMYSKGLPHNGLGEVEPEAYELLLRALRSGDPLDFDRIPCAGTVKLSNPQAGLSYNLVGPDPSAIACPPAPRFASATQAAEMVELYWQALARDVPFSAYEAHPLIWRAAQELGRLRGEDTRPSSVFRGSDAGSLAGPYISQFLLKEIGLSPFPVVQKFRSVAAGRDHAGDYDGWLGLQNGSSAGAAAMDPVRCFIRNGRDLAEYLHRDFSYQVPLSAALILLRMGAAASSTHPYQGSRGQIGFATFGGPHLFYLIATAAHAALTACWFQKWMVHRRLRPEEMAGRVVHHLARRASYPIHPSLLDSEALAATVLAQKSALLTSSYPEAAPTHPAYPAGHAVLAAAGTTILKAYVDEGFVIPEPLMANPDGQSLKRYEGPPLTLRGELDKLALNMGMGRCFAGIHWRSDVEEGLRLGEEVAIRVLREVRLTTRERFAGFRFHRLDGQAVIA
ncbi:MAG TPA: vanadium-dependent haloperoxidase, partial [Vicinamibacteria bacterium]|nr:vanadium-dependent haloperoxidase [Vicinamibacteria bacterium]